MERFVRAVVFFCVDFRTRCLLTVVVLCSQQHRGQRQVGRIVKVSYFHIILSWSSLRIVTITTAGCCAVIKLPKSFKYWRINGVFSIACYTPLKINRLKFT